METKLYEIHHPKTFARYNEMGKCLEKQIEGKVRYTSVRVASAEEMRHEYLGLSVFRITMTFFNFSHNQQEVTMEFLETFCESRCVEIIVKDALDNMVRFMLK